MSSFLSFSLLRFWEGDGGRVVSGEPWVEPLVGRPWFPHRLLRISSTAGLLRRFRASSPAFFLPFTQSSVIMNWS